MFWWSLTYTYNVFNHWFSLFVCSDLIRLREAFSWKKIFSWKSFMSPQGFMKGYFYCPFTVRYKNYLTPPFSETFSEEKYFFWNKGFSFEYFALNISVAWSHPGARSQLSVLEMFVIRRLLLICLRVLKIFKNKILNQQRKSLNDFLMKSFSHRKSQFWLHRGPLQDPWDRLHITPELTITDILAFESHFTKDGNFSVFVFVFQICV